MTKAKKVKDAAASHVVPGSVCPRIRLPWQRERLSQSFDPADGRTHQSFKDECDINNIIEMHTRTGVVQHLNNRQPQYGDCPDSDLFQAAVAQAAIRSATEEGWEPPADENDSPDAEPEQSEEAPQGASEAAPAPEKGDMGGE